jgi:hypothetical protein
MHLVRLASKEERTVAAFDDRNLVRSEKAIHRFLIEQLVLLELVDSETIGAASGRPRLATWRGATHWA